MQEFTADLKHRMRGVWRDAELEDPNTHNKLATYHSWFAIPFSGKGRTPPTVPWYLHLNLSKHHVMRNVSRFACGHIFWKLRQQRGLKIVLAYVTNVLVNMNMFKTRCMLFLLPWPSSLWAEETFFLCLHTPSLNHAGCVITTSRVFSVLSFSVYTFLRTFQQPDPFCCNRSTTNLFMISFLSRTLDFFLSLPELMD